MLIKSHKGIYGGLTHELRFLENIFGAVLRIWLGVTPTHYRETGNYLVHRPSEGKIRNQVLKISLEP